MSKRTGEALCSLGKASHVSQRGITQLLNDINKHGIPDAHSRASQYRARKDLVSTETPYGPLVQHMTMKRAGKPDVTIGFQNPLAFVHYNAEHSDRYAEMLLNALADHPSSPSSLWRIVLYQDGVDPGDGLAKNKSRHSVVFYWSFAEFGTDVLAHEEVWGTLTIARTAVAKGIDGGVAALTNAALQQFHGSVHDILRSGIVVQPKGSATTSRIFGKVQVILADLPALAEMISWKGHQAVKCCPCCMNATQAKPPGGAAPMHVYSGYCKPITEGKLRSFRLHTDASLKAALAKLEVLHRTDTPANLAYHETYVYGFTHNPFNILVDPKFAIDAPSSFMFDWAHVYVADGLLDTEFGACMKQMHTSITQHRMVHGCTYAALHEYMERWTMPQARGNPQRLLDADHARKHLKSGDFASTASEMLTIAPVVARFMRNVAKPQLDGTWMQPYVDSLIACLHVVYLLQAVKVAGFVSPGELRGAIEKHLALFIAAYGDDAIRPKHHFALHLPHMLYLFGFLISTFTHERKHRCFKRYARPRTSGENFELGVLEEMTCHSIWELSQKQWLAFSTSKPSKRQLGFLAEIFADVIDGSFTLHREVHQNGCITVGDVVGFLSGGRLYIGELLATVGIVHSSGDAEMMSVASVWEVDGKTAVSREGLNMLVKDKYDKFPTKDLQQSFTYRKSNDGVSCFVLVPWEFHALLA